MKTLYTERLILRPFRKGDEDDIFAILLDPNGAYFCDSEDPFQPQDRFSPQYADLMDAYAEQDNRVLVELKAENKVIGIISFWKDDHRKVPAQCPAFQFHPDYQRKGYATEALREFIRYLFEETDTQMVTAQTAVQNVACQALLRKLGFIHEGTVRKSFFYPPVGIVDNEWFSLEKP